MPLLYCVQYRDVMDRVVAGLRLFNLHFLRKSTYTVKPVCNDHLYNKIYYLWFIQQCVFMKTVGTNLLLLTISAF